MKQQDSATVRPGKKILTLEWVIFGMGLAFCLAHFCLIFSDPLLGQYSFRQTQTAISTYWMLKGGPWLAYETPVLGAPWAVPFEFPLYQWLVAILEKCAPFLSLDESGRIISESFFLLSLWPIWRIVSYKVEGKRLFLLFSGFLMLSPLYAFWAAGFMMESAVLFMSLWFLAALIDYLTRPSLTGIIEVGITAILAALIKITTFVGFSFAGALICFYFMYKEWPIRLTVNSFFKYLAAGLSVAASVLILWLWVRYSDKLKSLNLLGGFYTGKALQNWNFGTLQERGSLDLLRVILKRSPDEALGSWLFPAVLTVVAIVTLSRKQLAIYALLISLFVAPFFVFTNLHLVHHYYQCANSIFLIAAISYAIYCLSFQKQLLNYAACGLLVVSQLYGYWAYFYQDTVLPNREQQILLANFLRAHTKADDSFIGFGLDWSSEVPYYAERRALLIPDAASSQMLKAFAADLDEHLGGQLAGAVVICPNGIEKDVSKSTAYSLLINKVTAKTNSTVIGRCTVFSRS